MISLSVVLLHYGVSTSELIDGLYISRRFVTELYRHAMQ